MDRTTKQRGQMALIGALAGLCFYGLSQIVDRDFVDDRGFLALVTFAATFFTGVLAMGGPLTLTRAAVTSLMLATVTTLLFIWASFRFDTVEGFFFGPFPVLAVMILGTVPLPFFIAASGPGWRDYPTLFSAAWTIVVRYAAAWVFVAVVWGVIFLSDTLFSIVGLTVIQKLIDIEIVPFLVTGLTLGLALALVHEMRDYVSPFIILRLLRLLLPIVLLVLVVFVVALPMQGLSGLFGGLSAAATLLVMTGAAATLITTAVDQTDAEATKSPLLAGATQALALILPVPAGLAAYSVGLRVDQYGWTPDRLFAALMAGLAVAYGLSYAVAVIRRKGWMADIRRANIYMALAGLLTAALWLTPVLNAERISANTLVARYETGKTDLSNLDIRQLDQWGRAGEAARDRLATLAKDPGQDDLAAALTAAATGSAPYAGEPDRTSLMADFLAVLPVQPAGATADRDRVLAGVEGYELEGWLTACRTPLPTGQPGCVLVIADFNQAYDGNEAVLALRNVGDAMQYEAFVEINGAVERRAVSTVDGFLPYDAGGAALIGEMQAAPPRMTPAPFNKMTVGDRDLLILP